MNVINVSDLYTSYFEDFNRKIKIIKKDLNENLQNFDCNSRLMF